ncbi:Unknown protein sequence [Pseudomonas syringae pv. cilantro]|uniref:Uncharacterized protein n=1 Tax=Pseudomonas syringae pv. cilantro TaxID=81035 RepID=A0A0N0XCD1_PSESX|nr:Unknown protein sequence [Pseudomonas syringae pv. cilantro]
MIGASHTILIASGKRRFAHTGKHCVVLRRMHSAAQYIALVMLLRDRP